MSYPALHNLNLATSYVPDWGAWEVVREVVCNAIDADPDGMAIEVLGHDCVRVTTETIPELSQLFVIGHGTKGPGGDTIGQFGEGIKMAALAATRSQQDGQQALVMTTPTERITFRLEAPMGVPTLHSYVEEGEFPSGFTATITMPGVAKAYEGRIQPGMAAGPVCPAEPGGMRVYVKGVYIATLNGLALWDWNLPDIEVNRDRAMVNEWAARWAIAGWLAENITDDQAKRILAHSDSIEAKAMEYHDPTPRSKEVLVGAFESLHGANAVLAEGAEVDAMAARRGMNVVVVSQPELRKFVQRAGVQGAAAAVSMAYDLKAVDTEPYRRQIARLRELDELVAAPNVKVRVFEVRHDELKGYAAMVDMELWLSEALFTAGNDQELVRTYVHELAHFISSAKDGSLSFEYALDSIAGKLAMHVLGGAL